MHNYCINKLLNLKEVKVKNIIHGDSYVKIFIETKASVQTCPCCGRHTKQIHDYRWQSIKDLPFQLKHCYLVLKKRRYRCSCGKRFSEKYSFLARYQQRSTRLTQYIVNELRDTTSLKSVANKANVSSATIVRILDTIHYTCPSLKDAISIDEYKGNAETGKYQCIIVNPKQRSIMDILPDRTQPHLSAYFRNINRSERYRVKYFVCDMWQPYVDLAHSYFPNAQVIIDKYHFIRQVTWAIENVRKRLQKTMPTSLRKYYKRSHKLILTRYHKLEDEYKKACDLMLYYNDDLRKAHMLKEWFYDICQSTKYSFQRTQFYEWIRNAESSGIAEFEKCAATYRHWGKEILNSFKYGITNGPTEGFNNKIKVLKRISYGIRNFERFRTRILHSCN
ncbi:ISL3 family transposase [Lachnoclostridium phytofermentans]|uniref:Transposase IS204/IS1001/IS1096/IS1165 family protein n=1 Tax=Lachnoclostridium phytofermentans (strain ATCC 700394 / DSM 18823 / ISDg) TaxID=357809 RepID=A9KIV3_LACP7|nr:ISL3 family transposase [Lachnoclostridium phytofermentans]ABX40952.1 transposase IS204/IS1001/IS1096/IS1165 family protein [Lachnoclostridium phytofermentans ISDg]ABX40995.1 transposase IS204/IS1001/IS1096/IS1165 family protein [Lachnoclostridium phytofermentans ISDg]ABX41036.1 transposase IS204/IS1001/IS1096/IS1165 family protein [Lachnoclostridium phytofermentans ISDg]ABX41691.1 transposase IS204/IS1001/IS1096/IS1165 family protein [Lachnoclostridium phytofermentans ISDg]ABX42806.1 trans